ncbi:hypothetical protein BD626DRAFT_107237 [Schizophyllum amplum]|uniref:Uncharacterized protein n=1 Tax=Schizophyllum amplum TaxID=97359 RepID=A0A550CSV9_9AGAR|nr:hypothetical protein BD626DRAFT_107237 [Auriculariopsis ampla]
MVVGKKEQVVYLCLAVWKRSTAATWGVALRKYKRGTSKQHQRHIASYPRHVSLFAQGAALPKMGCRAASCIYSIQRESPGNHHQRTLIAGKEPGGEVRTFRGVVAWDKLGHNQLRTHDPCLHHKTDAIRVEAQKLLKGHEYLCVHGKVRLDCPTQRRSVIRQPLVFGLALTGTPG